MKKLGRWFWTLLAVGSWVVCAILADAKIATSVVIFISALGWFFIAIAIGGWKGLPFGLVALVFALALIGIKSMGIFLDWGKTKVWLDTLQDKPLVVVGIYIGFIVVLLGLMVIPIVIAKKNFGKK